MRKFYFAIAALLVTSTLFAGAENDDKQSLPIRPNHEGRLMLTPDQITGLDKVKTRMAAPVDIKKENADMIESRMSVDQLKALEIENRAMVEKHRTEAAIENARMEQNQAAPAPARASVRGGSTSHPYQFDQPFQAFGDDVTLTRLDYAWSTRKSPFKNFGNQVYTYDANGNVVKSEITLTNVNGVASQLLSSSSQFVIPVNATIKQISSYSDTSSVDETYYLDPITNERHDISVYKSVYYNGETVSLISKEVNNKGEMVEYSKIESDFDAKGRPVKTVRYRRVVVTDSAGNMTGARLQPYRKIEFEYPSDNLVTRTESNLATNISSDDVWIYESRTTRGTTDDGSDYYEYYYYGDTAWVGNNKYLRHTNRADDGSWSDQTYTYWQWNAALKVWEYSSKSYNKFNSRGNTVLSESYTFSTMLNQFYLTRQRGYEYQGDTLRCADWSISFGTPETEEQLLEPISLVNSAYKEEYMDYTAQELGWTQSDDYYLSMPRKYEIYYDIDRSSKTSVKWIPRNKTELQYVVTKSTYYDGYTTSVTDRKNYNWVDTLSAWDMSSEYKYEYNDHGDVVKQETYSSTSIIERYITDYKYVSVFSYGDSVVERRYALEEYWNDRSGVFAPSYRREYDFDKNGNTILEQYYSNWDTLTGSWGYGYKQEKSYDDNGNMTSYLYSRWNAETGVWVGSSKELSVYDAAGDRIRREYFNGTQDSVANTVWIPQSLEEIQKDDAGHIILEMNCYYWDTSTENWSSASKTEWTYSDAGQVTSKTDYYYRGGQWYGSSKQDFEYNAAGLIIAQNDYSFDYSNPDSSYVTNRIEYTYTESGESKDIFTYTYDWYGDTLQLASKRIAEITDGRITAYVTSTYDSWNAEWTPQSRTTFTYGDNGMVTTLESQWLSYDSVWQNTSQKTLLLDSLGRTLYVESYSYSSWYDSWVGDEKAEYAYDERGKVIMEAYYNWDRGDSAWVGSYKYEEAYNAQGQEVLSASYLWDKERQDWYGRYNRYEYAYDDNGNQTMYARYYWDDENWRWKGSSKSEYEYDADGSNIMSTYYNDTDSLGNWIGSSKSSYYYKDNVRYSEDYQWDYDRQDWRGNYKSEYSYSDTLYMSTTYEWDETGWCWRGESKSEQRYLDNGYEYTYYEWNATDGRWDYTTKELTEFMDTDNEQKSVFTSSAWDPKSASWVYDSRKTSSQVWLSNGNLDYQLMTMESYSGSAWTEDVSIRATYVYSTVTPVKAVKIVRKDIKVSDGMITVNAAPGAVISVATAAGAHVTSGTGSLSVSVAPGIYLINVGGNTTKVIVR
ncbi:MAG: hypothetical protein J5705_01320 [Bacteroidaceae bacterium]|nr:hypothetical protein [Bacteroidaceae bacterium]